MLLGVQNVLWYLLPLAVMISLVYSASRFELPERILHRAARLFFQIVPISVDGLAEQGNFAVAQIVELLDFIENLAGPARHFFAARRRDGAISAFEIAAENDVYISRDSA